VFLYITISEDGLHLLDGVFFLLILLAGLAPLPGAVLVLMKRHYFSPFYFL